MNAIITTLNKQKNFIKNNLISKTIFLLHSFTK